MTAATEVTDWFTIQTSWYPGRRTLIWIFQYRFYLMSYLLYIIGQWMVMNRHKKFPDGLHTPEHHSLACHRVLFFQEKGASMIFRAGSMDKICPTTCRNLAGPRSKFPFLHWGTAATIASPRTCTSSSVMAHSGSSRHTASWGRNTACRCSSIREASIRHGGTSWSCSRKAWWHWHHTTNKQHERERERELFIVQ